jgi:iron complex transport system ATP-binding protein
VRLALTDVSVSYGAHPALRGVSLAIGDGGWLGLIGPNGAGKSTVLKVIAGLVAYSGNVTFDAAPPPEGRRERSRLVAYVPQRPELPDDMTVFEYVLLGRTPHISPLGRESALDRRVAHNAVARLALAPFAERRLGTLSGGEAQRAVLARALTQEAPLLLLDEPTTGLDLGHQQQVLELVDELRREAGMTVISSMHDLVLAGEFPEALALLDDGRVAASGTNTSVLTEANLTTRFSATVSEFRSSEGQRAVLPVRTRPGGPVNGLSPADPSGSGPPLAGR